MKLHIKQLFISFFALSSFFIVIGMTATPADAEICAPGQYVAREGDGFKCQGTGKNEADISISGARSYLAVTAKIIAGIAFGVGVLMTTYAGYLYTVSEGDVQKTQKAKMQLMAAATCVFIAALSFVIYGIMISIMKI